MIKKNQIRIKHIKICCFRGNQREIQKSYGRKEERTKKEVKGRKEKGGRKEGRSTSSIIFHHCARSLG